MRDRAGPTIPSTPAHARASWRWSTWSLTRKLPVLTAAIVVLVVASSLALTYDALKRGRIEAMQDRLRRLARQLVATSDQNLRTRAALYHRVARDSAVVGALRAASTGGGHAVNDSGVARALLTLRAAPDSSLPIELWAASGQLIAHFGTDVPGDSSSQLRPEQRTRWKARDSLHIGAFYPSGGRVYYWTIIPVLERGRPAGLIAQQRAYRNTPTSARAAKELLGNDVELYLHNATDRFWSTYIGEPATPLVGLDTAADDFIGERRPVGDVIAYEARVASTPWVIDLEAPMATVLAEPRATLRRLTLLSLIIAAAGVAAAWFASLRFTNPVVSLAYVSEALARGDYATRVPERDNGASRDEVARLAASFNRMAAEIEASHRELEQQVQQALTVSQELETTNQRLQQLSADAGEARDAAQEANRAKSDFLAVMSHELRTPLNAIGGYADILQLGIYGEITEKQRDALTRITRSQQMLLSLINDVLNFAKLDAGQVRYRIDDVALNEALASSEALVAPQLRAKELTYLFEQCDGDPLVHADREKLQQIVLNLLSNAIKFTPRKGRITLSCGLDDDVVHVCVTDTGIGIAADRLDSIFDPFVQVDRALNRPHEGVGLGLSISRDLARGMGGTLAASSVMGAGARFTLTLRRVRQPLTGIAINTALGGEGEPSGEQRR